MTLVLKDLTWTNLLVVKVKLHRVSLKDLFQTLMQQLSMESTQQTLLIVSRLKKRKSNHTRHLLKERLKRKSTMWPKIEWRSSKLISCIIMISSPSWTCVNHCGKDAMMKRKQSAKCLQICLQMTISFTSLLQKLMSRVVHLPPSKRQRLMTRGLGARTWQGRNPNKSRFWMLSRLMELLNKQGLDSDVPFL